MVIGDCWYVYGPPYEKSRPEVGLGDCPRLTSVSRRVQPWRHHEAVGKPIWNPGNSRSWLGRCRSETCNYSQLHVGNYGSNGKERGCFPRGGGWIGLRRKAARLRRSPSAVRCSSGRRLSARSRLASACVGPSERSPHDWSVSCMPFLYIAIAIQRLASFDAKIPEYVYRGIQLRVIERCLPFIVCYVRISCTL